MVMQHSEYAEHYCIVYFTMDKIVNFGTDIVAYRVKLSPTVLVFYMAVLLPSKFPANTPENTEEDGLSGCASSTLIEGIRLHASWLQSFPSLAEQPSVE